MSHAEQVRDFLDAIEREALGLRGLLQWSAPMGRRRPYGIWGTLINLLGLYLRGVAFQQMSLTAYILAYLVVLTHLAGKGSDK